MAQPIQGYGYQDPAAGQTGQQAYDPQAVQQQYNAWQQYYQASGGQGDPNQLGGAYNAYFDQSGNGDANAAAPPQQSGAPVYPPVNSGASTGGWRDGGYSDGSAGGGYGSGGGRPQYSDRGQSGGYGGGSRSGGSRWGDNNDKYSQGPGAGAGPGGHGYSRGDSGSGYGNQSSYSSEQKPIVFVSGLPQSVNEQFIHDVFSTQGDIAMGDNGKPRIKIYQDHGISKGECTIQFKDEATAKNIIEVYNGQCFPGTDNRMNISMAKFGGDSGRRGGGGTGGGYRGNDRNGGGGGGFDRRGGGGGYGGPPGGGRGGRGGGGNFGGGRGGGGFDNGGFGERGRGGFDRRGGGGGGYGGRGGFDRRGGGGSFGDPPRRGGFGDRGGRGGRGGPGGGRGGGSRDGGASAHGGNMEVRPNDWMCPCGNNNFAFRRECNSCKTPKPDDAGPPPLSSFGPPPGGFRGGPPRGGRGGGPVRGGPFRGGDRHRPY